MTKKYYKANLEKIQRKLEEISGGTYWKPKEGKNIIRILPPWSDSGEWYSEAKLHYGLSSEGRNRAYPCLGAKCPICDYARKLQKGSEEDKKLSSKLVPRTKFYVNMLDRKTGKSGIWSFSKKTLTILLSHVTDDDWGDITDPEKGNDVVIERAGTGLQTKYEIRVKPKKTAIAIEGWEDQLHNLSEEVIEEMSAKELEKVLAENFGEEVMKSEEADDDDEDEEEDDDEE